MRAIVYKKKEKEKKMPQQLYIWKVIEDNNVEPYFLVSETEDGIEESVEFVGKYLLAKDGIAKVVRTTALVPFHK